MFSEIPFPFGIHFLNRYGISTFSIMMMLCFVSASYIGPRELARRGLKPEMAEWYILLSIIGTLIGAKVFFVFEVWSRIWKVDVGFWDTFYHVFFTWNGMSHIGGESMWGHLFSGSGLVFYGGLIVSYTIIYLDVKKRKLDFPRYGDVLIILLIFGYGIGRLGCFISGDGCFGKATTVNIPLLTWIYGPSDGYCPSDPALKWAYPYVCSAGLRVWNTPVIEAFFSFLLFAIVMLWVRFQNFRPGFTIAIFFVWNGLVRFLVEFIRLNDSVIDVLPKSGGGDNFNYFGTQSFFQNWQWSGFTQAQIIAIFLIISGLSWIFYKKLYLRDDKNDISKKATLKKVKRK